MLTLNKVFQRTFRMQFDGQTATCFTVDRYGKQYIVTARHVLPESGRIATIEVQHEGEWKRLDCKILARGPGDVDICILAPPHAISPSVEIAPTTRGIALGQDVYFLGFPFGLQSEVGELNDGFPFPLVKKACVSMLSLKGRDARYLLLDGVNNPGFSGGPVVFSPPGNSEAACIAAVVAGYRFVWDKVYLDDKETELTVPSNTGIIMAYSIEHALEMIRANPGGAAIV
ncbi:MAG: serine protease [Candidatus Accumulibacter sp.]|jgi:S1-C subfamily serine protease|nr:serine protease [Accumulibacter sp.]